LLRKVGNSAHDVTIAPRTKADDNKTSYNPAPHGSTDVKIHYDPADTKGDFVQGGGSRIRPPHIGLGKELSTAVYVAAGPPREKMDEEIESAKFENRLRDEYNKLKPKQQLPQRVGPK
jgi:hypothetical protein